MSGRRLRATAIVSSCERPSTSTTSVTMLGSAGSTCGRFAASFFAGMMTLTVGSAFPARPSWWILSCCVAWYSIDLVPTAGSPFAV